MFKNANKKKKPPIVHCYSFIFTSVVILWFYFTCVSGDIWGGDRAIEGSLSLGDLSHKLLMPIMGRRWRLNFMIGRRAIVRY